MVDMWGIRCASWAISDDTWKISEDKLGSVRVHGRYVAEKWERSGRCVGNR